MDCILVQLDQQKATRQRRMREKAAQTNLSQIYSIWNISWGKTNPGLFDLKRLKRLDNQIVVEFTTIHEMSAQSSTLWSKIHSRLCVHWSFSSPTLCEVTLMQYCVYWSLSDPTLCEVTVTRCCVESPMLAVQQGVRKGSSAKSKSKIDQKWVEPGSQPVPGTPLGVPNILMDVLYFLKYTMIITEV